MLNKPELLAPAGNLEKGKLALLYGADAIYLGGTVFGLRKYADNFSLDELKTMLDFAHKRNKQVYIVLNAFAHNSDIPAIIEHLKALNELDLDAAIVSDLGVAQLLQEHTQIPLHVSTQASATHHTSCQFWKEQGAKRVILAREVSVQECIDIQEQCELEYEIFVHGAMCASYSGKCVISNYAAGRDSNRGGCVQSCRHNYILSDPQNPDQTESKHIMNAKDLAGIFQIPQILQSKIASLKIEGRMKSNLYVSNAVQVYRNVIDYCYEQLKSGKPIEQQVLANYHTQLEKVSNREFSTGGLADRAHGINRDFSHYNKRLEYTGMIRGITDNNRIVCDNKGSIKLGDTLEHLSQNSPPSTFTVTELYDSTGTPIEYSKPNTLVQLPSIPHAERYGLLSKHL